MFSFLFFLFIFALIFLFFDNEKNLEKTSSNQKNFLKIFLRFCKIVIIPWVVLCAFFLFWMNFGFFSGGNIFINNFSNENLNAKIIYKQWNYIFHEENFPISANEKTKKVVPNWFSEWEIFFEISKNNKKTEITWGIDELYTRPEDRKIFIKSENAAIRLELE